MVREYKDQFRVYMILLRMHKNMFPMYVFVYCLKYATRTLYVLVDMPFLSSLERFMDFSRYMSLKALGATKLQIVVPK